MSCDRNNLGLLCSLNVNVHEQLSDPPRGLITVEEGHVAVHQNKTISVRFMLVDGFLYLFYRLFAIISEVSVFLSIREAKNHQKPIDYVAVKSFVINYKNFS